MDAQTLHASNGQHVGLYFCNTCKGTITKDRDWADTCCQCSQCKAPLADQQRKCEDCRARERGEREQRIYDAAEKIPAADYTGEWLYDPHTSQYFGGVEELEDHYENEDERIPHYVEACDEYKVIDLDADAIIEQQLDDHGIDEDSDPPTIDDLSGVAEFRAAVAAFNEANAARCYYFGNEKRLVILRPADGE